MAMRWHKQLAEITGAIVMLGILSQCGGGTTVEEKAVAVSGTNSGGGGGNGGNSGGGGGSGTASTILVWEAPIKNTDGTDLTDLAGYKIYYGTASRAYGQSVPLTTNESSCALKDTGKTECRYTLGGLALGIRYYFAATALDTSANESDYSNEIERTLQTKVTVIRLSR